VKKRIGPSRAVIFSRTMAAASGSGTFLAPGAAPLRRSPKRSPRARVRTTPTAKGQKGVRRVVSSPGQEQFPPGSTLGKMMNLRLNKINWRVLNDAADKLEGELASQPILGLVKAETLLRGVDALEKEGRGYREYILVRSLGLKMWFTHATTRAGVSEPRARCAVGKALASPDGEFNIYRRVLAHAPLAKSGDWEGFADGLAADARAAADAVTDADLKTAKVRYDASVADGALRVSRRGNRKRGQENRNSVRGRARKQKRRVRLRGRARALAGPGDRAAFRRDGKKISRDGVGARKTPFPPSSPRLFRTTSSPCSAKKRKRRRCREPKALCRTPSRHSTTRQLVWRRR
jgi:hypothetical protein